MKLKSDAFVNPFQPASNDSPSGVMRLLQNQPRSSRLMNNYFESIHQTDPA